ncbi:MAG: hypothetical protein R3A47_08145 [Polyangiales bacterium]
MIEQIKSLGLAANFSFNELVDPEFWRKIGRLVLDLGVELWIGGFALGIVCGVPLYFLSLRSVRLTAPPKMAT